MVTMTRSAPLMRMSFLGRRSDSKSIPMLKYCLAIGAGIVIGRISRSVGSPVRVAWPQFPSSNDNGWHDISVYYGDRNSINEEGGSQSQLGQDNIISNLMSLYHHRISSSKKKKKKKDTIRNTATEAEVPDQLYFVDLAANDAISLSNTFKLEQMGWDGLCIEPNPVHWYRLSHRKCAVAGAFVGGKSDMQQVDVSLSEDEHNPSGGIVGDEFDNKKDDELEIEKRFTVSITSLFQKFNVPQRIDYFSLDVEGAEELIMKDFLFDKYTVRFMTVERPTLELQKLLKDHDYHFVLQLAIWGETLWVHGSILKEVSLKDLKKNALETMGKSGDVEWPPLYWKKEKKAFDIETGEGWQ